MVKNGWKKSTTQITPITPRTISNDASNIQGIIEIMQNNLDITNEITKVQPRHAH